MRAKIENDEIVKYPYSIRELRSDNPNTMFPADFNDWEDYGVVDVDPTEPPSGKYIEVEPAYENGKWVQQWQSVPYTDEELRDIIAAKRYEKETGGFTFAGYPILSDDRSQSKIIGAALAATQDPNYTSRWKTASGFVELTASQIIAMATALREHVQGCFDREAELLEAVEDGVFESSMLDQGWP